MRILLAAFGLAALAVVGWIFGKGVQDSREWHEILAFAEKDFGKVSIEEESRVSELLQKRFPRPEDPWGLAWAGLRLPGPRGEERIVIFHGGGSPWPPALVSYPVSVLDGYRRDRSVTWVLPGARSRIVGLRGGVAGAPVPWCFELTIDPQEEVPTLERHLYGLLKEQVVLIRREDASGLPLPNDYRSVYGRIGEPVPLRSAEEWERALNSSDPAEILRTLLWLGGTHELPTAGEPRDEEESAMSRQAYADALRRPVLRSRVTELRDHPHPWVAEAAAQVEISD